MLKTKKDMFKIDLLKGQGVPLKTEPAGIAIIAGGIAVPFITILIMIGICLNNRVVIPIKQHELAQCEQKMQTLFEGVKLQQTFNKERDSINASVPEAALAVRKFAAWSPIIQAVAENMPGAMVLSRFDGKQDVAQSAAVTREVSMSISGKSLVNWDEEVKGFRNRLLESGNLKSILQDIPIGQQSSKSGEKDSVSYDLRMIFKAGM